ncbi:hypothetical protein IGI04_029922 [Brassica rapa subsp. trilocularis]|uniref:Uncharacterized protein n=1 Tax=Brassica rapa subsp. trilocularis TaxID=1813537 RepID=A0ABQ7LP77_BRACM|nr:hypothetical protein IGI04_029922 [Brassica rapa subsp. trilocularis]
MGKKILGQPICHVIPHNASIQDGTSIVRLHGYADLVPSHVSGSARGRVRHGYGRRGLKWGRFDRKIHTFIMAKQTAIFTGEASSPLLFRHVSPGSGDSTMQFRLLHHWEARKNVKGGPGIVFGIEMLMIDEEMLLATLSWLMASLSMSVRF